MINAALLTLCLTHLNPAQRFNDEGRGSLVFHIAGLNGSIGVGSENVFDPATEKVFVSREGPLRGSWRCDVANDNLHPCYKTSVYEPFLRKLEKESFAGVDSDFLIGARLGVPLVTILRTSSFKSWIVT